MSKKKSTNENPNKASSKSQCAMILAYLMAGHRLTSLEAIDFFGCARLASRVNDLRNRGHNVQKQMIVVESGKHVAQYYIEQTNNNNT